MQWCVLWLCLVYLNIIIMLDGIMTYSISLYVYNTIETTYKNSLDLQIFYFIYTYLS